MARSTSAETVVKANKNVWRTSAEIAAETIASAPSGPSERPGSQKTHSQVSGVRNILSEDSRMISLADDFGKLPTVEPRPNEPAFSFARLREHARQAFERSIWSGYF